MKCFKIVDFTVSIMLIVVVTIISLINADNFIFIGYFIVGGWQIFSMIIHFIKKWFCQTGTRRNNYHFTIFLIALYSCTGFIDKEALFPLFIVLLFTAPFQAIFYCWLCWNEITVKMKRPLSILK
ncbi:MAG: hypothetical protein LH615_01150 [Ferruginibacter sp.]|nr:hypothetical protein [Ferruginibacter sp.]